MSIAQMMKTEFPGQDRSLSGIGGVESGSHAAEFILLGASTVQVSTESRLHLVATVSFIHLLCAFNYSLA